MWFLLLWVKFRYQHVIRTQGKSSIVLPETGPFLCPLLLSSPLSMDPSLSWACWWRSSEVRACRSKELLISSRPIMGCLSKEEALRSEGLGMFLAPWTRAVWQGGGSGGGGRSGKEAGRAILIQTTGTAFPFMYIEHLSSFDNWCLLYLHKCPQKGNIDFILFDKWFKLLGY